MEKEKKVSVLQDIIRIKSVNDNELEVIEYLSKLFDEYGIENKIIMIKGSETRANLVVEYGQKDSPILALSGHVDVVSEGDASKWTYDPYGAEIHDGMMYGRGATDMKAGTMAICLALIELKEKNVQLNGKIRLLITAGEEVSMIGAEELTEQGYVDDIDGMIIAEPTQYHLVPAHKGHVIYDVKSKGKSCHSSSPELGINALSNLMEFYNEFKAEFDKEAEHKVDDILGKTIQNPTVMNAGDQPNTIPDFAQVIGSIRNTPAFPNADIEKLMTDLVAKYNEKESYQLSLEFLNSALPAKGDFNSDLMQVIQRQATVRLGKKMPELITPGATDASRFFKTDNVFDFVIFGPGEPFTAHQIDEHVNVDNYLDMIEYYQDIAKEYLEKKALS